MRIDLTNLTWQWRGDDALIRATARGDVACLVEARTSNDQPVRVHSALGAAWKVAQRVATGALAGCALAVRRTSGIRIARWQSLLASRAGHDVQQRNLIHAVLVERTPALVVETHVILVHNPLQHTGRQDEAVRAVRARKVRVQLRATTVRAKVAAKLRRAAGRPVRLRVVRWVVLGDFNRPHAEERKALGGDWSAGHDPIGAVFSPEWDRATTQVTFRRIEHADHDTLTIKETA